MKKSLRFCLLFLTISAFFPNLHTFAQVSTIDFNDLSNNLDLGRSYNREGFTFSINIPDGPPGTPVIVSRADGSGFEGTPCLYDNNLAEGALTQWTITKNDGSGFQFRSIFLQEAGVGASTSGTIQGFKNGNPTGPSKPIQFNSSLAGLKDYAGDSDFYDVDEIQIKADDINFFLDHFTHGPSFSPVDTDPTEVTSISLTGSPSANASSVVFAVNFNKTALNVSTDDFQLTTTGSVVGTIASVSGSGSEYLVTINGISGEGSLRLNLRSGTNITNENGNSGTPAFTSGQIHFVSPCFIETFEDEVVGSSSFSGNGLSFSLQGNWEVSQETPFAGIGGSQKHLTNTGDGPYIITSSELITMNRLALYLSSNPSGTNPTNDGTVTVKGFNNDVERFSIAKSSGFPTDGSTNSGYFFIDFSTEGGEDNTNKRVDRIEVSIGGNFVYLNLDNFEWCEAQPNNPPTLANPIPDQTAIQDNSFNFQFSENTFEDEDITDVLLYSAQLNGGGALPAWLSFNAATRTFSGTPLSSDIGEINIEVIANDQEGGTVADSFTLSIIPAIFFEDATFVFDGTEKSIEITGTLPAGTSVSYENNTRTNVGTQETRVTITGDNFNTLVMNADLVITPAALRIIADAGQSKIFGTADPEFSFTTSGFVEEDSEGMLTGSLSRLAGEDVGTYPITLGNLSAGENYQIQFTSADFEIFPTSIEVVIQPDAVQTAWSINPELPATVTVMTVDGQFLELPVTWDVSGLIVFTRGDYILTGTFDLPSGILNPEGLTAEIVVTVLPKSAPEDIVLENSSFEPQINQNFIPIGAFSVVDPFDNQHDIILAGLVFDNMYFEIIDGILFWSSAEKVDGRTEFNILVRVVDRDGNILEKEFTIRRTRPSVNDIEIFNTFTPNGDGVNDSWGVEQLRFYTGARIQVFERSGQRVFYTEDPDVRWDGTFQGRELPVGTYYWVIEVKETDEVRRGMLNLIRK